MKQKTPRPQTVVVGQSIEKDGGLTNITNTIRALEGRTSLELREGEDFESAFKLEHDTSKAVMHMAQGKATDTDRALLSRSNGAMTLLSAIEGNSKALKSIKAAAQTQLRESATEVKSGEILRGAQNDNGYGVRSEGVSSTRAKVLEINKSLSDADIYSYGEKISIPEDAKMSDGIVISEASEKFRKSNHEGYNVIKKFAKSTNAAVIFVDELQGYNKDGNAQNLAGYEFKEGVVINLQLEDPVRFATTHEFGHRFKRLAPEAWQQYQDYVIKTMKSNKKYDGQYVIKRRDYNENLIDEDIAADYAGELFSDQKELARFIKTNRGLAAKVRDMWYSVLDYFGRLDEKKKAQQLWGKAYREAVLNKGNVNDGEGKKSYAGIRAKSANIESLGTARQMEKEGKTPEEIWKQTGWGRGLDGKWRFEIDDFESYLVQDPKLEIHRGEDGDYYTGSLEDVFNHKKLFEAYPRLKETKIIIQEKELGINATAFSNRNEIVLSKALFERKTEEYKDLLNNRQKYIDEIEQTPEYKTYESIYEMEDGEISPEEWLRLEAEARKKFFETELGKRYYSLRWGKTGVTKYELGWSDKAKEVLLHEIQHLIQYEEGFTPGASVRYWENQIKEGLNKGRDAGDLYHNTAGEIEAESVRERANMTAKERRNIFPENFKINDSVVFSKKGTEGSYTDFDDEGNKVTVITENQGLFLGLDEKEMASVAERFANERYKNKTLPISDELIAFVGRKGLNKYLHSTNPDAKNDSNYHTSKLKAIGEFENLLKNATYEKPSKDTKNHNFAKDGFEHYKTVFVVDGQVFEGIIDVGFSEKGVTFYGMTNVKRVTGDDGKYFNLLLRYISAYSSNSTNTNVPQDTSVVNRNSMQNDIRYSISGTRLSDAEGKNLARENAELRAQLENMGKFTLSKAMQNTAEIRKAAEDLKRGYGSKMSVNAIQSELTELYNYMVGKDARSDEGVRNRIHSLAERVIAQATETVTNEQYGDLLDRIKEVRIRVPESERADFTDGYEYFRKHNMGKVNLVNEGTDLDVLWKELSNEYTELFDEEMTGSQERLERIIEIREEISPAEESVYKNRAEYESAVLALENDIYESFYNIPKSDGGNKFIFYGKGQFGDGAFFVQR